MKIPRFSDHVQAAAAILKPTRVMIRHDQYTTGETTGGLSVLFTMLCIVDLFGVFPVVALPKSIIACGVYGIPLVISVFSLQLYTAVLLGRCWLLAHQISPDIIRKSRYPYAAIAELAYGPHVRRIATFLIDASVFGAGVPNFIFASQSMQLFFWKITNGTVGMSYCFWMVIIGLLLCPVMWLGSPKDMKPIAITSVFTVTTVAVCTWTCIALDNVSPQPTSSVIDYVPSTKDFLVAYGILAFQFDIHPMLLTLQVDMKDGRKINRSLLGGFIMTGTMFTVTCVMAANRYGTNIDNNILQGIPPSITLYVVALLVTLQLCLSSAVGNSALFQHIEDLLQVPRDFSVQRCLIRSSIVALAVFLGEAVPRFDVIMGLLGSTLTGPLMFIFPPLFFLRLCYKKSRLKNDALQRKRRQIPLKSYNNSKFETNDDMSNSPLILETATRYSTFNVLTDSIDEYDIQWYDVVLAVIVVLMGISSTLVATYSSWADAITNETFSAPCLVNATAAARDFVLTSKHLL